MARDGELPCLTSRALSIVLLISVPSLVACVSESPLVYYLCTGIYNCASGATKKNAERRLKSKYGVERPSRRPLRIFAVDPMAGRINVNRITVDIPNEDLEPGPVDSALPSLTTTDDKRFYPPVNLDDSAVLMRNGLDPSESDPRFHQQMVYAVASRTLENFDRALGRFISLGKRDFPRLRLFPHAFHGANAFYNRRLHAVLFGYFRADRKNSGDNLPGQNVASRMTSSFTK